MEQSKNGSSSIEASLTSYQLQMEAAANARSEASEELRVIVPNLTLAFSNLDAGNQDYYKTPGGYREKLEIIEVTKATLFNELSKDSTSLRKELRLNREEENHLEEEIDKRRTLFPESLDEALDRPRQIQLKDVPSLITIHKEEMLRALLGELYDEESSKAIPIVNGRIDMRFYFNPDLTGLSRSCPRFPKLQAQDTDSSDRFAIEYLEQA